MAALQSANPEGADSLTGGKCRICRTNILKRWHPNETSKRKAALQANQK